jgi:limonene 1,2-monooxygenase
VWVGEHHSAGWELIASPEIFIAAAAERTRHIMLGSGVTSLPYHHPFLVAQRFVQLDHMTRGRTMLGCGPGALVSDAYMMGIEPITQRPRMDEALEAIMRLLACDEPVTMKTDWFELREARLHLAPYTHPHFPSPSPARSRRRASSRPASTASGSCRSAPGCPAAPRCCPASGRSPRRRRPSTARR